MRRAVRPSAFLQLANDAMLRIDRLDLLLRVVRDQPGITSSDLARTLGTSVRSVFRDLEHLRARGYPIEGERGRGGGVRLHQRWGLGKVLLSSEEALCTLLSLAISEKLGFPMFASDVARARRKIVDAFPSHERKRIGPLRERIFVGRPASAAVRASYREPGGAAMRQLQVAFVQEVTIRAEYVKENGEPSERRIEPHALLINLPAWYLLGVDHSRGEPRTFRLDRFVQVAREEASPFRANPRGVCAQVLDAECGDAVRPV